MPADGLEAQDVVPPRCGCWVARMAIFVAAIGFWQSTHARAKAHTLAPALSRCSACNHLEITAGDRRGWPLERCCSSLSDSIGIVRVLPRRLGLPRALCERGYRPSGRGHRCQRPAHHSGRHRGCRNPTRSRLNEMQAQRAELAAPPLLSFLHLGPNSA